MRILVTGGAGFIGSNFVRHVLAHHRSDRVLTFDKLTYAGSIDNLAGLEKTGRHMFERGDIASPSQVERVFRRFRPDAVVNFAAETHVDRSIHLGAAAFVRTNIAGVQVLLDAARRCGVSRFLQVSTDEVYGALGARGRFTEKTPLAPNNPYSASKAAADLLVRAANRTYGLHTVITRCSNNFGPRQFPEKLVPLMIANALEDRPLPVYGDGRHVRDWIYVEDHCEAVDIALRRAPPGSVYNIGSDNAVQNIVLVKMLLKLLGKPESLICFVQDRPGHDRRYAMDAGLIRRELGWRPRHSLEDGLRRTIRWYLENREWWKRLRRERLGGYYRRVYGDRSAISRGGRRLP